MGASPPPMSLNRFEHALFAYWETHPDELRHWRARVAAQPLGPLAVRGLERELWAHWAERRAHVPALRALDPDGCQRLSLLNLAEYIARLWSPPPAPPRPPAAGRSP